MFYFTHRHGAAIVQVTDHQHDHFYIYTVHNGVALKIERSVRFTISFMLGEREVYIFSFLRISDVNS